MLFPIFISIRTILGAILAKTIIFVYKLIQITDYFKLQIIPHGCNFLAYN